MKMLIDIVKYACTIADLKVPGANESNEDWKDAYDEAFNAVSDCQATFKDMPIKFLSVKDFCNTIGVSQHGFLNAWYQLDLHVEKERNDMFNENIYAHKKMEDMHGQRLECAINTFHPCLIKMIFAYLHKPELIDEAFRIIKEYGRS